MNRIPAPPGALLPTAVLSTLFVVALGLDGQEPLVRQGGGPGVGVEVGAEAGLTLRDASRDDRWLGLGVRDVRWALDGSGVYFRWHPEPEPNQDPGGDPWYRVDREGDRVEEVPSDRVHLIPPSDAGWNREETRATWGSGGRVYLYGESAPAERPGRSDAPFADLARTRLLYDGPVPARNVRLTPDGEGILFLLGEDLYGLEPPDGSLRRLTRRHDLERDTRTEAARWLAGEEMELFRHHRRERDRRDAAGERERARDPLLPQPIPVSRGHRLDAVDLSPDGRHLVFRVRIPGEREPTVYADYVTETGYAEAQRARSKVGEPRDEFRTGILRVDPTVHPDSVAVTWVEPAEAQERPVIIHGPWWSLEGDRAVVQIMSQDHKDLWISFLDLETGETRVLDHQHDPAWLGGPPPIAGRLQPGLLEWLPGGRLVFASEASGWSHLYLAETDGRTRPLTEGEWEVRDARLSRDRDTWTVLGSREHPADDHLYSLPAAGGQLIRLSQGQGRHQGRLSPDGERLARISDDARSLPDLFLQDPEPGARAVRITESGSANHARVPWVEPEIVSFPHPDGGDVWGALFRPPEPNPERAAVLHIHGGGYRQFAHRGWSVYGWANHAGFIQWLLQEGYTVLDFDYRGSSGFGRDYRTDIYRSMGVKDVDGAVAAAEYLVREHGVDPDRIGMYGVSYGGFFTLMSLFRYPGVFAAGVSNDGVTDWAHYSDSWTSRILNLPHEDPEAYRTSSPIYHAEGLEDPLLLVHGLIDDNVHFQDAARLVQRLIELEKDFDVMFYPVERHNFAYEEGRYDYYRRMAEFFRRHLLR